jgi:hypothetical protein
VKGYKRKKKYPLTWGPVPKNGKYPLIWGTPPQDPRMKKRVVCVDDGPRRLWKDDMMLDTAHEVRIPISADGPPTPPTSHDSTMHTSNSNIPLVDNGSMHVQTIHLSYTQGHVGQAPNTFFGDMKRKGIISKTQGNSPPLLAGPGEPQKALHASSSGVKRRAQSPVARERVTSNDQNNQAVWDPYRIFLQWNAAFEARSNLHPDVGERLQNSPLPTPADLGNISILPP